MLPCGHGYIASIHEIIRTQTVIGQAALCTDPRSRGNIFGEKKLANRRQILWDPKPSNYRLQHLEGLLYAPYDLDEFARFFKCIRHILLSDSRVLSGKT